MTATEQAALRLRSHAHLPGTVDDGRGIGKILRLWRKSGGALDLQVPLQDIIIALQTINAAAQAGEPVQFSTPVDRSIAYSMSCILADLADAIRTTEARKDPELLEQLSSALKIVTHAWSQLLAGDIDDLMQDLRYYGFDLNR